MRPFPNYAEKIIVALDGMTKEESISLITKIPEIYWVKVGLELFIKSGPDFISILRDHGKHVFLDLKFHDIPTTMAKACRQAARTGAQLITVHACAGREALIEANNAAMDGAIELNFSPPKLLAVTVLTSWNVKTLAEDLLIDQPVNERVQFMAQMAFGAGLGGCICSPLEVETIRQLYQEPFELVTPGIRLPGDDLNDQKRVMTPSDAISSGASRLVIGRPITRAINPAKAFEKFCMELNSISSS